MKEPTVRLMSVLLQWPRKVRKTEISLDKMLGIERS